MGINLNLFLAGIWAFIGIGLLWSGIAQDVSFGGDPQQRVWLGGFALVLAGYNVVRWRFTRIRRRIEEEYRMSRPPVRRHRDEPPNPDFEFDEPRPVDPNPSNRPPGSG